MEDYWWGASVGVVGGMTIVACIVYAVHRCTQRRAPIVRYVFLDFNDPAQKIADA